MRKFLFIVATMLTFTACTTTRQLTPDEVRIMTTHQYDADYSTVYASAMSLIQSEGFMITNTDKNTGLINATKEVANANSELELFLIGFSTTSDNISISVFVDDITPETTEVKVTIYEGHTNTTDDYWGSRTQSKTNKMVQKIEVYNNWFKSLNAEIERRISRRK